MSIRTIDENIVGTTMTQEPPNKAKKKKKRKGRKKNPDKDDKNMKKEELYMKLIANISFKLSSSPPRPTKLKN